MTQVKAIGLNSSITRLSVMSFPGRVLAYVVAQQSGLMSFNVTRTVRTLCRLRLLS